MLTLGADEIFRVLSICKILRLQKAQPQDFGAWLRRHTSASIYSVVRYRASGSLRIVARATKGWRKEILR
jgi:hypothetical protein